MLSSNSYNFSRIISLLSLFAIVYQYWGDSFLTNLFMLGPYIFIILVSNESAYKTKLRVICRVSASILVAMLALALLIGIESDAQAGIAIGFGILIQYGVVFVSESIVGLATYGETST